MILAVADTHAVIWYFAKDKRLSERVKRFIDKIDADSDQIGISSISFVEMVYLIEKGRIPPEHFTNLASTLSDPKQTLFVELPVNYHIARALSRVSAFEIPDMPDRIVAATAIHLNVPVISRDGKIRVSGVSTIW